MATELVADTRVADPGSAVPQPMSNAVTSPLTSFQKWLEAVDVESLTDRERVDLVASLEAVKGSSAATQARATDAHRRSREASAPQDVARSVGSEIALARRESPTMGDRFVGIARALAYEMPGTMAALTAGIIGERHAVAMVQATACLSVEDRAEVDRRVSPMLGRLGVQGVDRAARRVAAELDAASVVRRMGQAARSRRVTVRPAPDGMAYLTVLGPLREVVGAYAALQARAKSVVGGQCSDELPDGRGVGAVMADTALRLLCGRAVGQPQPIEVQLVVTDRTLFGVGDSTRSLDEPGRIPGHGSVPAPVVRSWLREGGWAGGGDGVGHGGRGGVGDDAALVWLRRLFTSPDGRDLVGMDSRRRVFTGLLRQMLVLRDDVCATPFCEGRIVHADHAHPARDGGPTSLGNGSGLCARCNFVKEAPGWRVEILHDGLSPGEPRELDVVTPAGRTYRSLAPPLTGWGWESTAPELRAPADSRAPADPRTHGARKVSRRRRKRPRASPLERRLAELLVAA